MQLSYGLFGSPCRDFDPSTLLNLFYSYANVQKLWDCSIYTGMFCCKTNQYFSQFNLDLTPVQYQIEFRVYNHEIYMSFKIHSIPSQMFKDCEIVAFKQVYFALKQINIFHK